MFELARVLMPIIGTVFVFWLITPRKARVDRDWLVIEYGWAARFITLLFFVFASFLFYKSLIKPDALAIAIFGALFLFAAIGVCEVFRHKLWLDSEKIFYQSPYKRRIILDVANIKECKVVNGGNEYRIVGMHGEKIGFTPLMSGATEVFELVNSYLANRSAEQSAQVDRNFVPYKDLWLSGEPLGLALGTHEEIRGIDNKYQYVVDEEARKLLQLKPEKLLEIPFAGIVNGVISNRKIDIGYWHYEFSEENHHVFFKASRRVFLFLHKSYISGIVFGINTLPRLMTDEECGAYD